MSLLLWLPMRLLVDIDILDDEALQANMAMGSLWIVIVGLLLGVLLGVFLPHEPITLQWFLLLGAVSVAALPVHELVHAAAFKIASGFTARIAFGFSSWMLYTAAPGTILPRERFCVVLLAPAVLVTTALFVGGVLTGWPLLGWFLAVIHLAGCTGDLGYVRIIRSESRANLVQDTERGIALFYDE